MEKFWLKAHVSGVKDSGEAVTFVLLVSKRIGCQRWAHHFWCSHSKCKSHYTMQSYELFSRDKRQDPFCCSEESIVKGRLVTEETEDGRGRQTPIRSDQQMENVSDLHSFRRRWRLFPSCICCRFHLHQSVKKGIGNRLLFLNEKPDFLKVFPWSI